MIKKACAAIRCSRNGHVKCVRNSFHVTQCYHDRSQTFGFGHLIKVIGPSKELCRRTLRPGLILAIIVLFGGSKLEFSKFFLK